MTEIIKQKIETGLSPEYLEVINESYKHKGHAGDNGSGETHFQLKVVYSGFEGLNRVERQKMIFSLLVLEMANGVHALSMKLKAPSEM